MKLRDIVEKRSPQNVDEDFIGGVAGCPDDYPELFEIPESLVDRPNCAALYCEDYCRACWDQEYCPAEDCISCDNVDCILHPGDGDD